MQKENKLQFTFTSFSKSQHEKNSFSHTWFVNRFFFFSHFSSLPWVFFLRVLGRAAWIRYAHSSSTWWIPHLKSGTVINSSWSFSFPAPTFLQGWLNTWKFFSAKYRGFRPPLSSEHKSTPAPYWIEIKASSFIPFRNGDISALLELVSYPEHF